MIDAGPRRPEPLRPGDTVGVIAPASPADPDALARGIDAVEGLGFEVKQGPHVATRRGYLAGSDTERTAAFLAMLEDPGVKAIFSARGGYGTMRMAAALDDGATARRHPKIVLGYSDLTFLHLWLRRTAGLVTFHGPLVADMGSMDPVTEESLVRALTDPAPLGPLPAAGARVLRGGTGSGPLIGGSLSLLCHTLGTPWAPPTRGAVLLVEDVGERPYRVDRMLHHLALAGVLQEVSALVFGSFVDCTEPGWDEGRNREILDGILEEAAGKVDGPVLADIPIGHGKVNLTVPLGVNVTVDGDGGRLVIEESALVP